jgi:hypothetical protein
MQQAAANGCKPRHKAKVNIHRFSLGEVRDPASSRKQLQRAANVSFSASPETSVNNP